MIDSGGWLATASEIERRRKVFFLTPIQDVLPLATLPDCNYSPRFAQIALTQDVEGYVLLIAAEVGWTKEETLLYAAQVRREVRSGKHHAYYRQKVVWGRKPDTS